MVTQITLDTMFSLFNQLPTAFVRELILTTTKIFNLGEARNYADTYKGLWLGG